MPWRKCSTVITLYLDRLLYNHCDKTSCLMLTDIKKRCEVGFGLGLTDCVLGLDTLLTFLHELAFVANTFLSHQTYTVFQKKTRTLKTGWYNFIKIVPLWIIYSEDALAFNGELTAFEKLDMGWVPTAQYPWQQQQHAGAPIEEANTWSGLKPLVVKVWGWLATDRRWQGP